MASVNVESIHKTKTDSARSLRRIENLCGWTFLIACCIINLYYINTHIFNYITTDASSVLVLSDFLWTNGKVIAEDFYYPTELYVLYEQLVYAPLFAFFSNDWHMIRVVGTAILIVMLLLCFYFLCSTLSLRNEYPWLASLFVLPISATYGIYVTMLTYYYFYVFVSMVIVGIALKLAIIDASRPAKPFTIFLLIAGAALGFLEGIGGLRIVINVILPLSVALGVSLLLYSVSTKTKRLLTIFAVVLFASAILGYALNATIIAQLFSFQSFGSKNWTGFSFDRLIETWNGILSLFGYQPNATLLSKYTIANLISLIIFFTSIFVLIKTVRSKKETRFSYRLLAAFICCSLVILTGIYSFSNMDFKVRYLIPTCIFFVPLLAVSLKSWVQRTFQHRKLAIPVIVAASALCLVVMGAAGYKSTANTGEHSRTENIALVDVANHMQDAGYSNGYSTYPYGSRITEFSNGKIEMWVFKGYIQESGTQSMTSIHDIYHWLQSKAHTERFPEEAFILFSREEIALQPYAQQFSSFTPLYENELFVVYDDSIAERVS